MDIFDQARRSALMSSIRSRGNQDTELVLMALLRAHKLNGWRRHVRLKSIPRDENSPLTVRPDFVFLRLRIAIFVDGCFWHGCPRHHRRPTSNVDFWSRKIAGNRARDRRNTRWLRRDGWTVIRIWEHSLRRPAHVVARIAAEMALAAANRHRELARPKARSSKKLPS